MEQLIHLARASPILAKRNYLHRHRILLNFYVGLDMKYEIFETNRPKVDGR